VKKKDFPLGVAIPMVMLLMSIGIILIGLIQPSPFNGHRWQKVESSSPLGSCPTGTIKGYTWWGVKPGEILNRDKIGTWYNKNSRINCYKQLDQ
jgi:hypothetical protein